METQGKKRVLSFEEFTSTGQDTEMDQMGMGEMPADSQGNQQIMMHGMPDSEPQINPEKEPETDLMMMDEPEADQTEAGEEPVAGEVAQAETDDVEESAGSWFTR
jgi:hypothetical protein